MKINLDRIDRNTLKNEQGLIICDLLPGVNIENIPNSFEIIEDLELLPDEINNKDFKFGKINLQTDKFEEDFVFFHHRLFLQCVDPKSYGLKDGLLIITDISREKHYTKGYLFFRYFKDKFYLIENFKLPNGSPTLTRDLSCWANENCSMELYDFQQDFFNKYNKGRKVDD